MHSQRRCAKQKLSNNEYRLPAVRSQNAQGSKKERETMKSYMAKPLEVERRWYVVDATDQIVGRLAAKVAAVLRGKNKPTFTPNVDTGDYVIIINADKVRLTGKKEEKKVYTHYTGFAGGLKEISYEWMMENHPERIMEKAIKGMLPHNTLGRQMYRRLKVYAGPEHNHEAQMPEELTFE